jgi:hypothetical protein
VGGRSADRRLAHVHDFDLDDYDLDHDDLDDDHAHHHLDQSFATVAASALTTPSGRDTAPEQHELRAVAVHVSLARQPGNLE